MKHSFLKELKFTEKCAWSYFLTQRPQKLLVGNETVGILCSSNSDLAEFLLQQFGQIRSLKSEFCQIKFRRFCLKYFKIPPKYKIQEIFCSFRNQVVCFKTPFWKLTSIAVGSQDPAKQYRSGLGAAFFFLAESEIEAAETVLENSLSGRTSHLCEIV